MITGLWFDKKERKPQNMTIKDDILDDWFEKHEASYLNDIINQNSHRKTENSVAEFNTQNLKSDQKNETTNMSKKYDATYESSEKILDGWGRKITPVSTPTLFGSELDDMRYDHYQMVEDRKNELKLQKEKLQDLKQKMSSFIKKSTANDNNNTLDNLYQESNYYVKTLIQNLENELTEKKKDLERTFATEQIEKQKMKDKKLEENLQNNLQASKKSEIESKNNSQKNNDNPSMQYVNLKQSLSEKLKKLDQIENNITFAAIN